MVSKRNFWFKKFMIKNLIEIYCIVHLRLNVMEYLFPYLMMQIKKLIGKELKLGDEPVEI